jgi:hypothetical protein
MNMQAALIKRILEKWETFQWTVQGFGMVRTKIYDIGRIHIWDSRLRVPLVSDVHAHPWPLRSTIISGELINQRFEVIDHGFLTYERQKIATGEGGGLLGEPESILLQPLPPEMYGAGDVYEQRPDELHRSIPQDGTVTLLERPMGAPLQETVVLWPTGTQWVSAEPRPAKNHEVDRAISYALQRWSST